MFTVALAWIAVGVLGAAAGYLTALQAAVVLGTALLGGGWADRRPHRRLMILADLARAAILCGLIGAWLAEGAPPAWALVLAVVALAAGQAFFRPALQAMVPAVVVQRERLPAANALLDTTDRIARLLGPGIVGLLGAALPMVHFVSVDVATFLISALALVAIGRLRHLPHLPPRAHQSALASALHGFAVLRPMPLLRFNLVSTFIIFGAWNGAMFLGLPLMLSGAGVGLDGYGAVIAAYGTTNVLATFIVGNYSVPERPAGMIFGGVALFAGGTLLTGLAGLWVTGDWLLPALCLASAAGAGGGPMEDVAIAVLRQTRVPAADQAAVMRAFLVTGNLGNLVAFLGAPAVFGALGAPLTVALSGALMLALAAYGYTRHRTATA